MIPRDIGEYAASQKVRPIKYLSPAVVDIIVDFIVDVGKSDRVEIELRKTHIPLRYITQTGVHNSMHIHRVCLSRSISGANGMKKDRRR